MALPETFAELQALGGVMLFLPRHRARAEYSLTKLHDVGFTDIVLSEGVDGHTTDARRIGAAEGWSFRPDMKDGEVGCSLSMLRLWRLVVDEALPYLLIFEDDVLPHPDVVGLGPAYWDQTPRDVDFVFLGNQMQVAPDEADARVVVAWSWTSHAYVVTYHGAQKALALLSLRRELSGGNVDIFDAELMGWMRRGIIHWVCWNGTQLPKAFPTSDDVAGLSSVPTDVAWAGRDTGLFYQNYTMGSTIHEPDVRWAAVRNNDSSANSSPSTRGQSG